MSNYNEPGITDSRPPFPRQKDNSAFEQVEMLSVPTKSHRHASAAEEQITALPQIGCVPGGSYSDTNVTREHSVTTAHWQQHEKNMV